MCHKFLLDSVVELWKTKFSRLESDCLIVRSLSN